MRKAYEPGPLILVVQDVEETRDGVEALLKADGYRVDAARDEEDAVIQAQRKHPDLILANLGMAVVQIIVAARRIRERAKLSEEVPVVIFCVEGVGEGDEVEIGQNVYPAYDAIDAGPEARYHEEVVVVRLDAPGQPPNNGPAMPAPVIGDVRVQRVGGGCASLTCRAHVEDR
jgi:CheY-like chemotaxis protein